MLLQMTGLSGAGKTTIANNVKVRLVSQGYKVEVLDGDVFRKNLCLDLGFSKKDRLENIRRMGFVGSLLAKNDIITIIAAINPYQEIRKELTEKYQAKIIWVNCELEILKKRDTKGLYHRAYLPDTNPDKIHNLTGVNDTFEKPQNPDLIIDTSKESLEDSVERAFNFIINNTSQHENSIDL